MDAGGSYAYTEFDVQRGVNRKESDSSWGPIAHAGLEYAGERTRASLDAFYDVAPGSGSDGPVQRTALTFSVGHLLTEYLRLGVSTGVFHNKSLEDDVNGAEDRLVHLLRSTPACAGRSCARSPWRRATSSIMWMTAKPTRLPRATWDIFRWRMGCHFWNWDVGTLRSFEIVERLDRGGLGERIRRSGLRMRSHSVMNISRGWASQSAPSLSTYNDLNDPNS